jgi:YfiH family protein
MDKDSYLQVNWPGYAAGDAPARTISAGSTAVTVHAVTTLKAGGVSQGSYEQFNLASHVGDDEAAVTSNREKLGADLCLPAEPVWLDQVHGNKVYRIEKDDAPRASAAIVKADASSTDRIGIVCAVLTADCLPVFICDRSATQVAVAHAGWRGLHQGIITSTVRSLRAQPDELLASLGPAIGPRAFEVGEEVLIAFTEKDKNNASAFTATGDNHYLCDIYQLARNELFSLGINDVSGGEYCTFSDDEMFYSYRRSKETGRMASLIWLQ